MGLRKGSDWCCGSDGEPPAFEGFVWMDSFGIVLGVPGRVIREAGWVPDILELFFSALFLLLLLLLRLRLWLRLAAQTHSLGGLTAAAATTIER